MTNFKWNITQIKEWVQDNKRKSIAIFGAGIFAVGMLNACQADADGGTEIIFNPAVTEPEKKKYAPPPCMFKSQYLRWRDCDKNNATPKIPKQKPDCPSREQPGGVWKPDCEKGGDDD